MRNRSFQKFFFPAIVFFILLLRFLNFDEKVDDPHAWRQYDTKQYIEGYYYHNDPFLEPSVCWMGNHKTLVLEFPLPEYIVAQAYHIFGPHLWVARLFILVCFALCLFFFYKILTLAFYDKIVAKIATLIVSLMPLSLYYSRAIHIDFFAFALSLGMLYFCMLAIKKENNWFLALAILFGSLAMLEKPPYCFYLAIPAIVFAYQEAKVKWFLKRAVFFIIPILCVILWSAYSKTTNAAIPDWSIIPGFNRFTEMWYWYFGNFSQRLDFSNWLTIWNRIYNEILGYVGYALFIIGALLYTKSREYWWVISLTIGTLIYMVLFFNLNIKHNYYQIPFIFPLAALIAMGLKFCIDRIGVTWKKQLVVILTIVLYGFESFHYAEKNYYYIDPNFEKVASEIKKNSKPNDVIIVSYGGLSPQCPIILQPASRFGFSIPQACLTPELIYDLHLKAGVTKLAIVYDGYFSGEFQQFFEAMENKVGVDVDGKGKALYMCDLKFKK